MAGAVRRFRVGRIYRATYYHFGRPLEEMDFLVTRRNEKTGKLTIQEIYEDQLYGKRIVKTIYRLRGYDDSATEVLYDIGFRKVLLYASKEVA